MKVNNIEKLNAISIPSKVDWSQVAEGIKNLSSDVEMAKAWLWVQYHVKTEIELLDPVSTPPSFHYDQLKIIV